MLTLRLNNEESDFSYQKSLCIKVRWWAFFRIISIQITRKGKTDVVNTLWSVNVEKRPSKKSARNLPLQVSGKKSKLNSIVILNITSADIRIIFNITSADIKTKSADVMLKMTIELSQVKIQ